MKASMDTLVVMQTFVRVVETQLLGSRS